MKANQNSILMFGHDEALLATRQWVLQSRGYYVLTMASLPEFASIPLAPPIRLLLVCHTVSTHECEAVTILARARWPGIQCLVLDDDGTRAPSGLLGQLLHTMDGPAKLVATVGKLIGSSPQAPSAPQL